MAYKSVSFHRPSSNIADLSYDEETKDLLVAFVRQGRQGIVHDIDANTVAELSRAPSAGSFFHYRIRDVFPYEEV